MRSANGSIENLHGYADKLATQKRIPHQTKIHS